MQTNISMKPDKGCCVCPYESGAYYFCKSKDNNRDTCPYVKNCFGYLFCFCPDRETILNSSQKHLSETSALRAAGDGQTNNGSNVFF